ncbi:MAG: rod shape-determining protein MreC [Chlamydia sp.]
MHSRRQASTLFPIVFAICIALSPFSWKMALQTQISAFFWALYSMKKAPKVDRSESELYRSMMSLREAESLIESEREGIESELYSRDLVPHVVAPVLFKEEKTRSSAIWVGLGRKNWTNSSFSIERYCPILSHGYLIGYIDYVGERVSRVLLITDPKLFVAVRVKRAISLKEKTLVLGKSFQAALSSYARQSEPPSENLQKGVRAVETILSILNSEAPSPIYFAYGYLQGASSSLSSSKRPHTIHGYGFNCDLDREGSIKRDLRTGKKTAEDQKISIIKTKDLLETSGLDGIFPKALPIASVSYVFPLGEGDNSYTIEAIPLREEFGSIHYVTILEALPQETKSPPSALERILSQIEEE